MQHLKCVKACLSVCFGAVLGVTTLTSYAAAPESLQRLNNDWQSLMNTKNASALDNYYDAESLLGQYPYDANKNLVGLTAIEGMFSNGPFKLPQLKADINTLAVDAKGDTAILLKNWSIAFDKGGFSGLALEVLEQTDSGWKRRIDLGAGGLKVAADFASQDSEADNSAFDGLSKHFAEQAFNAQRNNLSDSAAGLDYSQAVEVNNLLQVSQGRQGLLVSVLNQGGQRFLTFNALQLSAQGWNIQVQLVEKL